MNFSYIFIHRLSLLFVLGDNRKWPWTALPVHLDLSTDNEIPLPHLIPRFRSRKRNSQLQELGESTGKLFEEQVLVLGKRLNMLSKDWVKQKHHVTGQHHEFACAILKLIRTCPRLSIVSSLGRPPLLYQQAKVFIRECVFLRSENETV